MHEHLLIAASRLSDEALLAEMKALSGQSREITVKLIADLVEIARRGIYRAEGPGKLFGYLTRVLSFSEAAAWNRIQAARAVRKFPVILDLLVDGSVNLTTIRLLGPHLTKENYGSLLAEATGKGKNDIKKMVVRLAPRPDVPATIRKLPAPAPTPPATEQKAMPIAPTLSAVAAPGSVGAGAVTAAPLAESHRSIVEPLAPERYRLQLTVDQKAHDDLRWLQDTMRREIPDGNPAEIVARALAVLRGQVEKKAFAATSKPRASRGTKPGSRDIPAAVQRKVWRRDGGQCGFVARNGTRCDERSYLEYHHAAPYVWGGEPTLENISLRCRAHNVYEAEVLFGRYEPRVRETPATYAAATCSGTNRTGRVPRSNDLSSRGRRAEVN
jgi:hypothetical protein